MHRPLRVGVISDTHGLVRPEALSALAGSDHIIHAGDVVGAMVLRTLEVIAPLIAVRGNNDLGAWAEPLPERATVTLGGVAIHVLHDWTDLAFDPAEEGISVVITGHSHKPLIERVGTVLHLNPGSAGPRRFKLPVTLARLEIAGGRARAEIVELLPTPA